MNVSPISFDYYFEYRPSFLAKSSSFPWEFHSILKRFLKEEQNKLINKESEYNIVRNSLIHPKITLGDFTLIRDSYVCEGATVGAFCEISNSIVLPNAMIPHHNFISHSIVGKNAKVGGNVRTAVRRLDRRQFKIMVDNKQYTCSSEKIGAIIGDGTKIGSSVVLNPLTVIGKNCIIEPLRTLSGFIASNSHIE